MDKGNTRKILSQIFSLVLWCHYSRAAPAVRYGRTGATLKGTPSSLLYGSIGSSVSPPASGDPPRGLFGSTRLGASLPSYVPVARSLWTPCTKPVYVIMFIMFIIFYHLVGAPAEGFLYSIVLFINVYTNIRLNIII